MTELSTIDAAMSDPRVTKTVMGYPSSRDDFWNELIDRGPVRRTGRSQRTLPARCWPQRSACVAAGWATVGRGQSSPNRSGQPGRRAASRETRKGKGRVEIRAAELTADHLGRRIKLDRTDDDRTFAIARIVRIRYKQIGDSDETETRLTLELVGDQRITPQFNRLGVVQLL